MTVGPDGTVRVNAFINYSTTGTLTKLAGKIQYRTTVGSGSWVDLTSEVQDASGAQRSEEHTSELQSLMRISYAVFCLKKKIKVLDTIDAMPQLSIQFS